MADLSSLSTEDLLALKAGDISKISTDGLLSLKGEAPKKEVPLSTKIQAVFEGFGERAFSGALPRIQAAAGGLLPESDVDEQLREQGFSLPEPTDTFQSRFEAAQKRQQQLKKDAPGYFLAGQIPGMLLGAAPIARGLKAIPALAGAGALTQAGLTGAIQGAIESPQELSKEEGIIPSLQLSERAKGAAIGGALGGVSAPIAGLAKKGAQAVKGVAKSLQDVAQAFALKSAGAMTKELRQEVGRSEAQKLGKKILERKLVKAGDTLEDILERASNLRQKAGKELGSIYRGAEQKLDNPEIVASLTPKQQRIVAKTDLDASRLAKELEEKLTLKYASKAGGTQAVNQITARTEELRKLGQSPDITEIHQFRQGVDDLIDWSKAQREAPVAQQALRDIRSILSKKVQNRIRAFGAVSGKGISEAKKLKDLNQEFSINAAVEQMAKKRLGQVQSRLPFGLVETGVGSIAMGGEIARGGLSPEALLMGLGAGMITKGARKFGAPIVARGAELGSKVAAPLIPIGSLLEALPSAALKRPGLLGGTAAQLPSLRERRIKALEE